MREDSAASDTSVGHEAALQYSGETVDARDFARIVNNQLDFHRLTLALEVVATCSLRCPGCWVGMARPGMWTAGPGEVMSPELFDAALTFGRELGASRLTLLGGEPTLHPNLSAMVEQGTRAGYKTSVTTNGVCSPWRLAEILGSGLHGISFSLDGSCAPIHDSLRPSPSGRSTFHLTLESIRQAVRRRSEYGYTVSVNHTIYPRNLHDAEAMMRLSARLGADSIRLHFTLPGDFPESSGWITYLEPYKWLAVTNQMPDLIRELRVPISTVQGYGGNAVTAARNRKSPYLSIQPKGDILLCAAYARLPRHDDRSVGRLLPTGQVLLNQSFVCATTSNHCCGAIPRVIEGLPLAVQDVIKKSGGLGCIILNGPLVELAIAPPN